MKKDIPNNEERSQAPRFSYKRADRHRKKTPMAKLNALFAQLGPKRLAVLAVAFTQKETGVAIFHLRNDRIRRT